MTSQSLTRTLKFALVAAVLSGTAAPVFAQDALPAQMSVQTQGSRAKTQVLKLPIGRSAIVDLPIDASDVFVSNPKVADAVLRTPRRIFVLGTGPGTSDALFFDRMGRQILSLSIHVEAATDQISDIINRLYPGSRIEVQALNDRIVLSGQAASINEADQIARLAASYVKAPENVINLLSIAGKDQVAIKVRVVEVNRTAIKQLGLTTDIVFNNGNRSYGFGSTAAYSVNQSYKGSKGLCYGQTGARTTNYTDSVSLSDSSGTNSSISNAVTNATTNSTTTTSGSSSLIVANSNSATVSNGTTASTGNAITSAASTLYKTIKGTDNSACLQAFERAGLMRMLAEPNLTAVSGESAKFLAGGEFPVPVGRDNQGNITLEFKPYGVGLGFTPVVLSDGRISLKVSSEVSELTNDGALVLSGLVIPGLSVRRNESTVELASGESIMLAGLLQSKYKAAVDSLPGMTTLPIIGALFRSRDFLNEQSEMVVILTAYIVTPTSPDKLQTPADGLIIPNDLESVFLGRINKVTNKKHANVAANDSALPQTAPYAAPVGYVIE